jgi:O-succinylbenzoic acid--CoA ligase
MTLDERGHTGPGFWLERCAARRPNAEAYDFGGTSIRYGELLTRASTLRDRLRSCGLRRGDVVAALLENEPGYVHLLHAVDALGAVLLPLNWRLTAAELAHQLTDSGARILLYGNGDLATLGREAMGEALSVAGCSLAELESIASKPEIVRPSGAEALAADTLLLLYTSGTTGAPKGAMLGRAALAASARASESMLGAASSDRWLLCMPLFHVGGLSILIRSCLAGSTAVVHPRFDPAAVDRALDHDRITLVSLVPAMLERLLEVRGDRPAPPSLRLALLGGGPASISLLERASALGFRVAPTYGLTEAASQVATRLPDGATPPLDTRLTPLPGTAVRIIDEAGRVLGAGAAGEICVAGPSLMSGYIHRPEATARALRDGWLHTGDVGTLDEAGRLRVLDRRDDLVVSGGENVYPAEIEGVLCQHPAIREAAVVGRVDERYGARPMAYVVTHDGRVDVTALIAFCRKHLAGYKVPVAFELRDSLPRNAAGKLLRRRLRGD